MLTSPYQSEVNYIQQDEEIDFSDSPAMSELKAEKSPIDFSDKPARINLEQEDRKSTRLNSSH